MPRVSTQRATFKWFLFLLCFPINSHLLALHGSPFPPCDWNRFTTTTRTNNCEELENQTVAVLYIQRRFATYDSAIGIYRAKRRVNEGEGGNWFLDDEDCKLNQTLKHKIISIFFAAFYVHFGLSQVPEVNQGDRKLIIDIIFTIISESIIRCHTNYHL